MYYKCSKLKVHLVMSYLILFKQCTCLTHPMVCFGTVICLSSNEIALGGAASTAVWMDLNIPEDQSCLLQRWRRQWDRLQWGVQRAGGGFCRYGIQKPSRVVGAIGARVWSSGSGLWGAHVRAEAGEGVDERERVAQELVRVLLPQGSHFEHSSGGACSTIFIAHI